MNLFLFLSTNSLYVAIYVIFTTLMSSRYNLPSFNTFGRYAISNSYQHNITAISPQVEHPSRIYTETSLDRWLPR